MKNMQMKELVFIALFAAVLAVLAQISIPMPSGVPITLQTFAIALTGYSLGARRGSLATGIYLLLGICGVPVFSMFRGGLGALLGATGGFLIGFLPQTTLTGLAYARGPAISLICGLLGLAVCHLCGTIWYAVLGGQSVLVSFLAVSAPYLLKDVVSVVVAYIAAHAVCRRTNLLYFR